jgi:hypothetical protein
MRTKLFLLMVLLSISSLASAQSGVWVGVTSETSSGYYTVQWQRAGPAYEVSGWWQSFGPAYQTNWGYVDLDRYPRWGGHGWGRDRYRWHGHDRDCGRGDWRHGHDRYRYSNHRNWR